MKKLTVYIEGMMCDNCRKHVQKALNDIEGVEAEVDLKSKKAVVNAGEDVNNEQIEKAVEDAGYKAVRIEDERI